MHRNLVNATNVIEIANGLLNLEIQNLQEKYHPDAEYFVHQLQKNIQDYLNQPESEYEFKKWRTIDTIERTLKQLIQSVNGFLSLLTPETKKELEQQFHSSKKGAKIS